MARRVAYEVERLPLLVTENVLNHRIVFLFLFLGYDNVKCDNIFTKVSMGGDLNLHTVILTPML